MGPYRCEEWGFDSNTSKRYQLWRMLMKMYLLSCYIALSFYVSTTKMKNGSEVKRFQKAENNNETRSAGQ